MPISIEGLSPDVYLAHIDGGGVLPSLASLIRRDVVSPHSEQVKWLE
jgi:hypothetical protein